MKCFRKKQVTEKKALGKSVLLEQQQDSGRTIHHPLHFPPSIFISPSKFPTPPPVSAPPACSAGMENHFNTSFWVPTSGTNVVEWYFPYGLYSETTGRGVGVVFGIPPLSLLWLPADVNRYPESQKKNYMKTHGCRWCLLKPLLTFTNHLCQCSWLRPRTNTFI